ncbi:MAG: PTS sugar transporter subunit IIA [Gammaproteobacteria bacterium]|nr:PTS sugar transporter subunit IIA [Gammaproteobacteria bacterium]
MMDFDALLAQDHVAIVDELPSRKTALRQLAESLAQRLPDQSYREIFFKLQEREQEGSTSLDEIPVAIPHCRVEGCEVPIAALLRTRNGSTVDFGGTNVQLIFAMCFPQNRPEEALEVLRMFVTVVGNNACLQKLLLAESPQALHELLRIAWQAETLV